jgi:hypothetical protein
MSGVQRIVGRVIRVGESHHEGQARGRIAHYDYIEVATADGRARIEGVTLSGEAAYFSFHEQELDMLCSHPVQHMKRTHFGGKASTLVYAVKDDDGAWLGADNIEELAKARGQTNVQVLMMVVFAPVAALATFFAGGAGGLWALWLAYKARKIAKTMPTRGQVLGAYKAVTTTAF